MSTPLPPVSRRSRLLRHGNEMLPIRLLLFPVLQLDRIIRLQLAIVMNPHHGHLHDPPRRFVIRPLPLQQLPLIPAAPVTAPPTRSRRRGRRPSIPRFGPPRHLHGRGEDAILAGGVVQSRAAGLAGRGAGSRRGGGGGFSSFAGVASAAAAVALAVALTVAVKGGSAVGGVVGRVAVAVLLLDGAQYHGDDVVLRPPFGEGFHFGRHVF
mmetsp:Transcript_26279/g.54108  ORF Transcript_26279/g.54108 Transcript_26279/m.54108 type:complete len:210 (+) Transcript_26279:120-749(+)